MTDPPYGVDYAPAWRQEAAAKGHLAYAARRVGEVANDDRADWRETWVLCPGPVLYCWHADQRASSVQMGIEAAGFSVRAQLIWVKPHLPISRGAYHVRHEPLYYAVREQSGEDVDGDDTEGPEYAAAHEPCWYAVRRARAAGWRGGRKQSTVWEISLDRNVEGGHSTQKPLECMARPIRNHTGDVYDPFLGSGTTIVAAEQLGRIGYGMEVDPRYVGVTLQRLKGMGLAPRLLGGD